MATLIARADRDAARDRSPRCCRDTWIDYVVRIITIGGLPIPSFWFGMLIMLALLALLQLAAADHLHADLCRTRSPICRS